MTHNIQYILHLLLQSKYRVIINFALYITFYLFIINNQVTYCMTEGSEIPEIAEAKEQPSHQVRALKKEIIDFVGTRLPLIEQIRIQEEKIAELTQTLQASRALHNICLADLRLLEEENIRIFNEISTLPERVNKKDILQLLHNSDSRIFDEKVRSGRIVIPDDSYKDY